MKLNLFLLSSATASGLMSPPENHDGTGFHEETEAGVINHYHGQTYDPINNQFNNDGACPSCEIIAGNSFIRFNSNTPFHEQFKCAKSSAGDSCLCECATGSGPQCAGYHSINGVGGCAENTCSADGVYELTDSSATASRDCDSGFTGMCSRLCQADGTWADEDCSSCVQDRPNAGEWCTATNADSGNYCIGVTDVLANCAYNWVDCTSASDKNCCVDPQSYEQCKCNNGASGYCGTVDSTCDQNIEATCEEGSNEVNRGCHWMTKPFDGTGDWSSWNGKYDSVHVEGHQGRGLWNGSPSNGDEMTFAFDSGESTVNEVRLFRNPQDGYRERFPRRISVIDPSNDNVLFCRSLAPEDIPDAHPAYYSIKLNAFRGDRLKIAFGGGGDSVANFRYLLFQGGNSGATELNAIEFIGCL